MDDLRASHRPCRDDTDDEGRNGILPDFAEHVVHAFIRTFWLPRRF
jgi:hypothetical protein